MARAYMDQLSKEKSANIKPQPPKRAKDASDELGIEFTLKTKIDHSLDKTTIIHESTASKKREKDGIELVPKWVSNILYQYYPSSNSRCDFAFYFIIYNELSFGTKSFYHAVWNWIFFEEFG